MTKKNKNLTPWTSGVDISDTRKIGATSFEVSQNAEALGNTFMVGPMSEGMTTLMNHKLTEDMKEIRKAGGVKVVMTSAAPEGLQDIDTKAFMKNVSMVIPFEVEPLDPDFFTDTTARFRALDEAEQKQIISRIEKAGMFEQLQITATTDEIFNSDGWPYPMTVITHLVSWAEAHNNEMTSYRDTVELYFNPKPIKPRW